MNERQEEKIPPGMFTPYFFSAREEFTLKDYACIHLKVPKTGKPWLDELITESLRNELAGRVLSAGLYDVNDG